MGKISEAIKKGIIEGIPSEICGDKPIIIKDKKIIDVDSNHEESLQLDQKGYFLIAIEDKKIYAGFVTYNNEMIKIFRGDNGLDIFKTILRLGLIQSKEHAAYVGYELGKAEECLKNNWSYVQS